MNRLTDLEQRLEDCLSQLPRRPGEELVRLLMGYYAAALERLCQRAGPQLQQWTDDPLISSLLVLHDLHPLDLPARVQQALERVRPQLGAGVSLLEVSGGVARLRLEGVNNGRQARLKELIGRALEETAPDLEALVVEAPPSRPSIRKELRVI